MSKKKRQELQFAVCISNEGYEASLEMGKLYRVIPDDKAAKHGYMRIVDESGEDYGYSAKRFFPTPSSSNAGAGLLYLPSPQYWPACP